MVVAGAASREVAEAAAMALPVAEAEAQVSEVAVGAPVLLFSRK